MKMSWLHKNGNSELIIFFSGWGIEPTDMKFLKSDQFDVVMLHSFTSLNDPEIDRENYEKVIVISFSFGVYFAGLINLRSDENYAFNGTLKPVDNKHGIREIIFNKTLENLDAANYRQFISNMFDDELQSKRFLNDRVSPDIAELKQQLSFIDSCELQKSDRNFDKVFISGNDKIIPTKNQERFWTQTKTETINSGHFPFFKFSSWDEMVEKCRK